jgi:F0F1-type ATP synthase assembly protein I
VPRSAQRKNQGSPSWLKFSGIGFELVAAVAGFAFVGWWIDRKQGTAPWGLLIGAGLGMVGGLYNLIRASMAASREAAGGADRDERAKPE